MLNSFKSLELVRYYVSNSIEKNMKFYSEKNAEKSEQVANTMFSTTASLIATFISTKYINLFHPLVNIAIIVVIAVVVYGIAVIMFQKIGKLYYKRIFFSKKYSSQIENIRVKQIVDDFDHIACDNILIAYELMKRFESDIKLNTFYYYEILYYLKSAILKVNKVLDNPELCVNGKDRVTSIDIYRIYNLQSIMGEIFIFLENQVGLIEILDCQKQLLDKQLKSTNDAILDIKEKCANVFVSRYN